MKHRLPLLVAVLAVVSLVGCASMTPERQLLLATETYASAVRVADVMLQAGVIEIEEAESIDRYRAIARQALDRWRAAVVAGEPGGGHAAAFELALTVIESEITRAQGGPSNGSDRDSAGAAHRGRAAQGGPLSL